MSTIQLWEAFEKDEPIQRQLLEYANEKKGDLWFGKYQLRKYLGKGSFARVFRARNSETEKVVALKVIDLQEIDERYQNEEISEKARKYLMSEENNMRTCKSAYVLKMYESFTNSKCKVFALEYCNGATLEHYIRRKGRLEENYAVMVLKEIIFGLGVLLPSPRKCTVTASSTGISSPPTSSSTTVSSRSQISASPRNCLRKRHSGSTPFSAPKAPWLPKSSKRNPTPSKYSSFN
jgi:hypothetical protein